MGFRLRAGVAPPSFAVPLGRYRRTGWAAGSCWPWYWHLLEAELRERGHDVAADLPSEDDSAGLAEYGDAVVEGSVRRPAQRRLAVTIQPRESNQIPSPLACAASISRSRSSARSAATGSSRFSTSFVHVKLRTQFSAAATSGP
jgi:hypothetical protein